MLVSEGLLSDVQLMKALAESKRKGIPIGSMLFEMGLISLSQLKTVFCILKPVMKLLQKISYLIRKTL